MSRALVTGGSGFLGSHIADTLSERGFKVAIFDRQPSPWLRPDQRFIEGDLADRELLEEAARGASAIFHLAALADLDQAHDRPVEAARANVLGTVHALEAARATGCERFVFASTIYVYSRSGGFYRVSKQAAEAFVEEYGERFDLPYTILRYGSLYGPRSDGSNGFHRLLAAAARGERIRHVGTPEDTREYIHVADAAGLTVDALGEEFRNRNLVLTGSQPTRIRDLFTMFSEILGRELEVDYVEDAAGADHYRMTPYSFSPRVGHKVTPPVHVDMGQGILELLDRLYREGRDE